MESNNRKMALAGIIGTIVYAVADAFLYLGTDIASDNKITLWEVPEWRLMASMWIGVIGSLLLLLGFISLAKMFGRVFKKAGKFLILPAFLCIGGVLYMHFVLEFMLRSHTIPQLKQVLQQSSSLFFWQTLKAI